MIRALVTGATGFIGSALVRRLQAEGYNVVGLSRRWQPDAADCVFARIADPSDGAEVRQLVAALRPDLIFHLAGAAAPAADDAFRVDIAFTGNLLAAAARLERPPRVVLVGSAAEYGVVPDDELPAREDRRCRPISPYGEAKLAQTRLGLAAAEAGLPVTVARLFNVVGPGMPGHLALGRFARSIAAMGEAGGVLRTGALDGRRDFVGLDDATRILAALGRAPLSAHSRIVNVCTGRAVRMEPLVRRLIRISGRPVTLRIEAERRGVNAVNTMIGSTARLAALGLAVPVPDFDAILTSLWTEARRAWRESGEPAQPGPIGRPAAHAGSG